MFSTPDFGGPLWLQLVLRILFSFLKYAVFAGGVFALFYAWKGNPVRKYRIQKRAPSDEHIKHEITWSLISRTIFSFIGFGILQMIAADYTLVYNDIATHGWAYYAFTVVLLIVGHDAYFYWVHRLMHTKALYKYVHAVHHHSTNPTPLASFSFHPTEAILEAAYFPAMLLVLPLHPSALASALLFQLVFNLFGHAGFEFWPKGWVHHPVFKYINSATHHNLHHAKFKTNYSLYFNWWDRIGNTMWPQYEAEFDRVKSQTADPAIGQAPMRVKGKDKPMPTFAKAK